MKHIVIVMAVLTLLLSPLLTLAQDEPAPGSGGVIVLPNAPNAGTMADVSMNPLRASFNLGAYTLITDLMFPYVVGVSPFTQYYGRVGDAGVTNALATDWTISDDGLTYTFTLRRDAVWSDGVPTTFAMPKSAR